jgi:hypothetical protein
MAKKTTILSCRLDPALRDALEVAALRERRSLSNFMEGAALASLPPDLRAKVDAELALSQTSKSRKDPT